MRNLNRTTEKLNRTNQKSKQDLSLMMNVLMKALGMMMMEVIRGSPGDTWLVPKRLYGNSELDDDGDGGDDGNDAEHDGERADVTTDGGNHRETKQDQQDHQEKAKQDPRKTKQDPPKK